MSLMDLYSSEALLQDRERICLAGYLLMKDSDDKAKIKAYVYSREEPVTDSMEAVVKKCDKWFTSPKVQAFLKIWEEQGRVLNEAARGKAPMEATGKKSDEEMSAIEDIIQRYEKLYEEAEDVDDKAKILKMIVDARHKNKDEVKDDTRTTRIYLPQRCSECVLYQKEKDKKL